ASTSSSGGQQQSNGPLSEQQLLFALSEQQLNIALSGQWLHNCTPASSGSPWQPCGCASAGLGEQRGDGGQQDRESNGSSRPSVA
ncbi:hypothetical protein Dimus_037084, partial [Dionaea muscipula]